LKLFVLIIMLFFSGTVAYAQTLPVQENEHVISEAVVSLTAEEKQWISEHPLITATNKMDSSPNEFVRAGEAAGFSVDYLNLIAENVGLKIEYVNGYSWSELITQLEERKIDVSHNIFQTNERTEYLNFTDPYVYLPHAIFKNTGSENYSNDESFEGKSIGISADWAATKDYKKNNPDLSFIDFNTPVEGLLSLSEGNIDLYIGSRATMFSLINKNFISNLDVINSTKLLTLSQGYEGRIAARNDWPLLINIIKKGKAAISEQQLSQLLQKWQMPYGMANEINLTEEEKVWLSEHQVINVASDPSIAPVEFIKQEGEISGIAGSLLDIFSNKLNIRFEWIENKTFDEGLSKIHSKEADIVSAISTSDERTEYLIFTDSYFDVNTMIFGREGENIFGNMESLSGHRIAMPKGFVMNGMIKQDFPDIEIIETNTKAEALRLVSSGVADAHIGSVPLTAQTMAAENITNISVVGVAPYNGDISIGIRADLPLLASIMQKTLLSVSQSEMASITSQWVVLKPEIKQNYDLVWQIIAISAAIVALILIWNFSLRREVRRRKFSEERFKQIAETVDGLFYISSPDLSKIKYVSPNFEKWSNHKCQDLYDDRQVWRDMIHPDDLEMYLNALPTVISNNFSTVIPDYRIIQPDGLIRWLSTQTHPVYNEQGEISSVIGVVSDVTSKVRSNAKLNEINNQFQNAFAYASHGMALVSLDGNFIRVNEAYCETVGYTSKEFMKLTVDKLTHPEDRGMSKTLMDEVLSGKRLTYQIEKRLVRKDGTIVPAQVNVSLVKDNNNMPVHYVAQIQDLSALKEREEQLRHSHKMDAVGKLTGGIAHDFNNILGIILGNLEILKSTVAGETKTVLRVDKAISGVDRGANLIKKLLSFSRKTTHAAAITNVNDHILNIEDFIKKSLTVSVKINKSFAKDLWPVEIDSSDLEDAILNLSLNARDAMPEGGELTFETENITLDEQYTEAIIDNKVGDYVVISVGDTGTGIEPELIDKVIEPFFTTKAVNKGTGLGLSMVHGFIQRSGGHMKIISELGKGTTFKLYIPRSYNNNIIKPNQLSNQKDIPSGKETILVVEDEKHLCEIAEAQLINLGYSVFTANNATYALEILNANKDIDLLFSDIVMPNNLDGYEMASSALKIHPKLKILFTSGNSQNLENKIKDDDAEISRLALNMLHKPYNHYELAIAIRKSLDV
jgi:PAS domain S-box-containing protein